MIDEKLYGLLMDATERKPLCRFEYQLKFGMDERSFRREIEKMRNQGIRVVSSAHSKGYWIAKTDEEYRQFRKETMSRINKLSKMIRLMDANINGQIGFELKED